ncbi:NADH-quinone oxidoreductase subunit J [Aeribacillus pallidus]|jgi:NADH-quinone oxidoreductase subunit J|uniref:NADH-quinone oxidoreductase subunit J n=1 Tax=Aeribacillus pallidus TaxID=33936 RepID=UPI003D199E72
MTISGAWILFVVLAGGTIAGGVMLLLLRKVVHMMMSLVLTFVSLAGIYVFLSAEFMAVVQILLYSGAVTIMLLFGLMLSKDKEEPVFTRTSLRYVLVTLSTIGFGVMVYAGILQLPVMAGELTLPPDAVATIGKELFTKYFIPFELTSVVLLASLVGAVILAKKEGNER